MAEGIGPWTLVDYTQLTDSTKRLKEQEPPRPEYKEIPPLALPEVMRTRGLVYFWGTGSAVRT